MKEKQEKEERERKEEFERIQEYNKAWRYRNKVLKEIAVKRTVESDEFKDIRDQLDKANKYVALCSFCQ